MFKKYSVIIVVLAIIIIIIAASSGACSSSSSSSYDLHNPDGSLNMEYVDDMNEYFKNHPEKLP